MIFGNGPTAIPPWQSRDGRPKVENIRDMQAGFDSSAVKNMTGSTQ